MTGFHARVFTGRKMAIILVTFFGVVAAVNFTMARYARSTFGGVVVQNSYVASQEFNDWLADAEAQKTLGWEVKANWRDDQRIEVQLEGVPVGAQVEAVARHPLGRLPDQAFSFATGQSDIRVSKEVLPSGRWLLRLQVKAGTSVWRSEEELR